MFGLFIRYFLIVLGILGKSYRALNFGFFQNGWLMEEIFRIGFGAFVEISDVWIVSWIHVAGESLISLLRKGP